MYKKFISAAVCAAVLAASPAALCEDDIKVVLDGSAMSFEVPPQIINDRTLVPLRAIFEAIGAAVDWDEETRTVTAVKDGIEISLTVDSYIMTVDDRTVELDSPAVIVDDRTLVPVRAVSESFGAEVGWDAQSRTVTIETEAEQTVAPTAPPAATAAPEETAEPSESAEPSAQPVKTPSPDSGVMSEISYNNESEQNVAFMRGFELLSAEKNSEGDYEITYTFRTFKEGRGEVVVIFDCLDKDGRVIDSFGGSVVGTDYTWSVHEAEAVIPGDTVSIEFSADKSYA